MSDEHKRLEVGANGSSSNSSAQPSTSPGRFEGMKAERPLGAQRIQIFTR